MKANVTSYMMCKMIIYASSIGLEILSKYGMLMERSDALHESTKKCFFYGWCIECYNNCCQSLELKLQPEKVTVDFEQA